MQSIWAERQTPVLPPKQRTLPHMLLRQAQMFGNRALVSMRGANWTHSDVPDIAARRAGSLAAAGVRRGDRVAIMCSNRAEILEVFLGCGWLGAVAVPINTASMGPQIEYVLKDSESCLLVIESQFLNRLDLLDLGRTKVARIWSIDPPTFKPVGKSIEAWPLAGEPLEAAPVGPADTLAILYTSGTTGPAKGVQCPHAQYFWWGANTADILNVNESDVLCTTLPLGYINALNTFAQAALVGCRVSFLDRFSASGFWAETERQQATVIYLLGAMVPMLLAQPVSSAERSHSVRIGLGPGVPAEAGHEFKARTGISLVEGYGSTETNFVIAAPVDAPRRGIMGWVRPGIEARVVDEADNEVAPGVPGELVLRADEPFAFATGYFGRAEATVEAWRNLWFHTGDRVVREDDGVLIFVDRIKDAIRRRGANISSWEVEQILMTHPALAAAAVYPVHSELAEDEVMAAIVLRDGAELSPAELVRFCETRLPKFAIPRFLDFIDDLPRTESGKVQKYKLRERGVTANCWDRQTQPLQKTK